MRPSRFPRTPSNRRERRFSPSIPGMQIHLEIRFLPGTLPTFLGGQMWTNAVAVGGDASGLQPVSAGDTITSLDVGNDPVSQLGALEGTTGTWSGYVSNSLDTNGVGNQPSLQIAIDMSHIHSAALSTPGGVDEGIISDIVTEAGGAASWSLDSYPGIDDVPTDDEQGFTGVFTATVVPTANDAIGVVNYGSSSIQINTTASAFSANGTLNNLVINYWFGGAQHQVVADLSDSPHTVSVVFACPYQSGIEQINWYSKLETEYRVVTGGMGAQLDVSFDEAPSDVTLSGSGTGGGGGGW